MNYQTVIGIDVSKKKLDMCVLTKEGELNQDKLANTQKSIKKTLNSLLKAAGKANKVLICAEYTGAYIYPLVQAAKALSVDLWLENPTEIKYSSGMQRGKNDKVDAVRIAEYAQRYQDKARLYEIGHEAIERISSLYREREGYVTTRAMYKANIKDKQGFMPEKEYKGMVKRQNKLIKSLTKNIKEVEQKIDKLIKDDRTLSKQYEQITSVDAVGKQTAIYTMVTTRGFTRFKTPKQLCCHAGVAPFAYLSGSSQHSRWRVSHRANKTLKKLLHMAALSAINMKGEMKEYYQRKLAEGKNAMSVLNAIRAKLIHRIYAVIKQDRKYEKNYTYSLVRT